MASVAFPRAHSARWPAAMAMEAGVVAGLLVLFRRDAADMAGLWWNVSTYQHCLFIAPIIAWLVWQRHREVAAIEAAGWLPGLLLVFGGGLIWLVGQAGGVALFRHAGLVAMIGASVIAFLGPAVARACAFPLFYLVFLVPFGDEFVGPMQVLTARMATGLLHLTGFTATLDGVFITTPAGWFEVAEACAGVKFLIALVAYAALVAHVAFRTTKRRALFMAAAIVLPVLANGVRAWGTIVAAELTSVEAAGGFDHIVYGWFFFAFVTLVLMAGAWRFFDRRLGDPWLGGRRFTNPRSTLPIVMMAPLALLVAALPVAWDAVAASRGRIELPARVDLPVVRGWTRVADGASPAWTPRFDEADHRLLGRYGNDAGQRIDIAITLYGWQGRGREIVGYGQGAVDPEGHWAHAADLPSIGGGKTERLLGPGRSERVAVTFWSVGGREQRSKAAVKLAALTARLTGSDRSAATMIVSAQGPDAAKAVDLFLMSLGAPDEVLQATLDRARGR